MTPKPIYEGPPVKPDWDAEGAIEELKKHLQTAMLLELHTIPLYLFAAYSVKDNAFSTHKFLTVVKQEMLHLALSGNVLRAIGGHPKLYGREFVPIYPVELFYDKVVLSLRAAKDNVDAFVEVERPEKPIPKGDMPRILEGYASIGQFYQETLRGLRTIHDKDGDAIFHSDSFTRQFHSADGSWYDEDMTVVRDLDSAEIALNIVIDQGEGNMNRPVQNTVQTHHQVFTELQDQTKHPLVCYPVLENPKTFKFSNTDIYKVMIASDAAYSYLLMTIEQMWNYDGPRRRELVTNNIMSLMMNILKPLAQFLVTQPLKEESNASVPFNFYEFNPIESAYDKLRELMNTASQQYPTVREVKKAQQAVNALLDIHKL